MTRLVRCLVNNGPLVHYWSMRYESKHRQLQLSAVFTNNKINLLKSFRLKNQLRLAYLRVSNTIQEDDLIVESVDDIDECTRNKYFGNVEDNDEVVSTSHATLNGTEYHVDMVFVTEMGDNDLLRFGRIVQIFIKNHNVYLLMQPLTVLVFEEHCYAYRVNPRKVNILKNANELPDLHPCLFVQRDNSPFVATKYIL